MPIVDNDPLPRLPVSAAPSAAPVVGADFDTRWAAWVERGRTHELGVRRRFVVCAGVLTIAAAIVGAFLQW
jgi:hypothetical protein